MKYNIVTNDNGTVTFRMRTGKDLVRSAMPTAYVYPILAKAKNIEETEFEIIVDDKYFFPITRPRKKKNVEVTE